MINNAIDLNNIYRSRYYNISNIESTEKNVYTYDILFKKECITDVVCRKYENSTAFHEQFAISKENRHKGHAKKIHKLECKGYREHNINKIELNATRDGVYVWGRLGFNITEKKYHNILLDLFRDYLIEVIFPNDINSAKILMQKCKTITKLFSNDFKQYILPDGKQSFTEYMYHESRCIGTIKMEKVL